MKSIKLLELVAASMQSFHKVLDVGMKVAGDHLLISMLNGTRLSSHYPPIRSLTDQFSTTCGTTCSSYATTNATILYDAMSRSVVHSSVNFACSSLPDVTINAYCCIDSTAVIANNPLTRFERFRNVPGNEAKNWGPIRYKIFESTVTREPERISYFADFSRKP